MRGSVHTMTNEMESSAYQGLLLIVEEQIWPQPLDRSRTRAYIGVVPGARTPSSHAELLAFADIDARSVPSCVATVCCHAHLRRPWF